MITQTPEQSAFIAELKSGTTSITLNAVAGSGKTTTLVMALNELKPMAGQALALAFNKKIAMELSKRLPPAIDCRTLNSLGHSAWQQHLGRRLTLNDRKIGEICSAIVKEHNKPSVWRELKDLVCRAKDIGLAPHQLPYIGLIPDTEESWITLGQNFGVENPQELIPMARKVLLESIKMGLAGTIDFADQLYLPCITKARMPQYKLVLVDEAQDLSEIQHELISRCVNGRLVAVGDPHQAIYGFRGASCDSMAILSRRFSMIELGLTYSFRCPQKVIALAQRIVPQIKCPNATPDGTVTDFGKTWTPKDLKDNSVVLCRNIAPLVRLGFQCFRANVSCWIVGRDIGAPIIKAAKELVGDSPKALNHSAREWLSRKRLLANGNFEAIAHAEDTTEALHYVIEMSKATSPSDIDEQLRRLFSKDGGSVTLSTIHRAKGLEWDDVYILDQWRIPAKYCQIAAANDAACSWMLEQEANLKYIAITRAKKNLTFIEYETYA